MTIYFLRSTGAPDPNLTNVSRLPTKKSPPEEDFLTIITAATRSGVHRTTNVDNLPADIRREIGGQEESHFSHLFRRSSTT